MHIHHTGVFVSWVPRLWFDKEGHQGRQERQYCHLGLPFLLKYVKPYFTILWVDIGMENFCRTPYVRRVSRVVFRDSDVKVEISALVA